MAKDDGGPAFPAEFECDDSKPGCRAWSGTPGMSLRDYFAGQALPAILANGELVVELRKRYGTGVTPHIADTAYDFADAMLEARDK